jgi:hypothetical protein
MRAFRPHSPRTLIVAAALSVGACGAERVVQPGDSTDFSLSTAGRLDGVVTRENGSPAQGLLVTALNHGVVVLTATTSGGGAFSMTFVAPIGQQAPGDTLLTFFMQARAAVGGVSDSVVLRQPVPVRMSRDVSVPVVTRVVLRAAF